MIPEVHPFSSHKCSSALIRYAIEQYGAKQLHSPPSITMIPESHALLPTLSSPPSVMKPSVTGGVASEIKPMSQLVLFEDNVVVSYVNPVSDPIDDEIVDADSKGLAGETLGSINESIAGKEKTLQLSADIQKDNLTSPGQTSNAKRSEPSVRANARSNSSKRGRKK